MTKIITTLSMRPENLQRHLNYDKNFIVTGRDDIRGNPGDLFRIEGDERTWTLIKVSSEGLSIDEYAKRYHRQEGFLSDAAYKGSVPRAISALGHILRKMYGDNQFVKIYAHTFHAMTPLEETK